MIRRDESTPERKAFWDRAKRIAAEVRTWPDWKRAGINVADARPEPRPPVIVDLRRVFEDAAARYAALPEWHKEIDRRQREIDRAKGATAPIPLCPCCGMPSI